MFGSSGRCNRNGTWPNGERGERGAWHPVPWPASPRKFRLCVPVTVAWRDRSLGLFICPDILIVVRAYDQANMCSGRTRVPGSDGRRVISPTRVNPTRVDPMLISPRVIDLTRVALMVISRTVASPRVISMTRVNLPSVIQICVPVFSRPGAATLYPHTRPVRPAL